MYSSSMPSASPMYSLSVQRAVVEIDPHEAAVADLGAHLAQAGVRLAEALLESLLLTRDVDAVALGVERPRVKDAGDALRVADRIVEQRVAAVRADVVEGAHLLVLAAHDDERRSCRMREGAIVERAWKLGLVAADDPALVEDLLLLLAKDRLVGVDARIDEMRLRELRLLHPLFCVAGHVDS